MRHDLFINRGTDQMSFSYQLTDDGEPLLTLVCSNKYGTKPEADQSTVTQISGKDFEKFKAYIAGLGTES